MGGKLKKLTNSSRLFGIQLFPQWKDSEDEGETLEMVLGIQNSRAALVDTLNVSKFNLQKLKANDDARN